LETHGTWFRFRLALDLSSRTATMSIDGLALTNRPSTVSIFIGPSEAPGATTTGWTIL
jgi:hypothetical protein